MSGHSDDCAGEGALLDVLLTQGDSRPHAAALTVGADVLSWGELKSRVLALAGAIAALKAPHGGRVAILGGNSADLVISYLATLAAGRCAVPLPASATAESLSAMLDNCEPHLIFADGRSAMLLDEAVGIPTVILDAPPGDAGSLSAFMATAAPLQRALVPDGDAPFNVIYSSGTTGEPKGIVHSHAMRYRQTARTLFDLGPSSAMLLATPLYSNTTLMPLLATLFHGGHVVLMPKFDAEDYLDLAERFGATHTMLVPVQYQRILSAGSFGRRNLGSFLVKQCTSAPLAKSAKQAIVRQWPGQFLEVYGLTEGGCTCILDATAFPDKTATVGRPAPGNDIRIIDENGTELPAGSRGEVIGRSGTMMLGYFRNEAANEAFRWRNREGFVFHRTGDIGMFDAEGFLTLIDRKKDVIISGGFNIYASDLEAKLVEHPAVAEAAVIGVPSETWGETPLGFVVLKDEKAMASSDLLAWVNGRVGKMQRLSAIELRPALPRSNIGKVLKQELRRPYWADGKAGHR